MNKKLIHKLILILVIIIPIIFWWLIITPFIKYMYNETYYSYYNPYYDYQDDFNELAEKMWKIKPINKMNIEWRYYISFDSNNKYIYNNDDLILKNWKNIYDMMNKLGIISIFHWENWQIDFKLDKFLLWRKWNIYIYNPNGIMNNNIIEKRIVKKLSNNWVIYNNN